MSSFETKSCYMAYVSAIIRMYNLKNSCTGGEGSCKGGPLEMGKFATDSPGEKEGSLGD